MLMERQKNETYIQYCIRLTNELNNKNISYSQWAENLFGQIVYGDENLRRVSNVFNLFIKKVIDEKVTDVCEEDIVNLLKEEKNQIIKERKKLQTENLQYAENQRNEARNELFYEKIVDAINNLHPIKTKEITVSPCVGSSGLLCLYDLHAGSTYEIKGLYNEIVNKYNFEEMQNRLWYLLGQMVSDDIPYDDLTIVFGGDLVENVLRISSLAKLKEPVVDTVIKLSEFLSEWIACVHDRIGVPINVVVIGGNHDINRILGSKKYLPEENLSKIICEFLKLRLHGIKDIIVDDYTECAIKNIRHTNIMFEHGEADPSVTLDYFSNLYNINIDEGYFGHLHRQESKSVGIADVGDRMVYRVGSICGIDQYAKQLRKANRASATFVTYSDNGRDWAKTYYLN